MSGEEHCPPQSGGNRGRSGPVHLEIKEVFQLRLAKCDAADKFLPADRLLIHKLGAESSLHKPPSPSSDP